MPTCYACYETDSHFVVVLEPCAAGEVLSNVACRKLVAEAHTATLLQQVLSVLDTCHRFGIAHRCVLR